MSLIDCPECGNKISDKAESCPHCGLPSGFFVPRAKGEGPTAPLGGDEPTAIDP
jgi:predicted amidophosphoribosyltransferase